MTNPVAESTSLFAELNNITYVIGVDFTELSADESSTEYGRVKYNGVTVTNFGTKKEERFNSGHFNIDFIDARQCAQHLLAGVEMAANLRSFCIIAAPSLHDFVKKNDKYEILWY